MKYQHIVICGGGFSGSIAALVSARFAARVTVLERYPDAEASGYAGTPQSHHVHIMLKHGQRILDKLVPGLLKDLEAQGAREADWAENTVWSGSGGTAPHYRSGLRSLLFSRKLVERLLRERIDALNNVEVVAALVTHIEFEDGRARAIGLKNGERIEGFDLCIEARGRTSQLREALEVHVGKIPEDRIENTLRYATTVVDHDFGADGILQHYRQANSQDAPLGYYASYAEGNRVIFTSVDYHGKIAKPFEQLKEHPFIRGKTLGAIHVFSKLHNHRIRYGEAKSWIDNLVVIGDAVCRLNPVYGQGLTICLEQVDILAKALGAPGALRTHKVQKSIDQTLAGPWSMVKIDEMRSTRASPNRFYRAVHRMLDFIGNATVTDQKLNRISLGLLHKVESPLIFLRPDHLLRIAVGNIRYLWRRHERSKLEEKNNLRGREPLAVNAISEVS